MTASLHITIKCPRSKGLNTSSGKAPPLLVLVMPQKLISFLCILYNMYMEMQSPNREDIYFNSVTHFILTEPTNKIPSLQHFTLPQFKQSVVSDEHHITSLSKTMCWRLPVMCWVPWQGLVSHYMFTVAAGIQCL